LSAGTIFTITPSGTLTTLFTFNGLNNDGGVSPGVGLVQGTDGNFYGTNLLGRSRPGLQPWLWEGLQNHPRGHGDTHEPLPQFMMLNR
jgi:hypothetical protein